MASLCTEESLCTEVIFDASVRERHIVTGGGGGILIPVQSKRHILMFSVWIRNEVTGVYILAWTGSNHVRDIL